MRAHSSVDAVAKMVLMMIILFFKIVLKVQLFILQLKCVVELILC